MPGRTPRQRPAAPIVVDTVAPQLSGLTPDAATSQWFSPNGDGSRDTVSLTGSNSETGSLTARIRNGAGTVVRTFSVANGNAAATVTWNGRNNAGATVPDGTYTMSVSPVDLAGNSGEARDRTVVVISALRSVITSKPLIFPQDNDGLARSATLQFTLSRPMEVTWTLRDASGAVVITRMDHVARPAGTSSWTFDGRRPDGSMLPRGKYTSHVVATDGVLTATQTVTVETEAFRITPSDTTPGARPVDHDHGQVRREAGEGAARVGHPAGCRRLERPDEQDGAEDLQGDPPAQGPGQQWHGRLPGLGSRRERQGQPDHPDVRDPLAARRARPAGRGDLPADRTRPPRPPRTIPHRDHRPMVRAALDGPRSAVRGTPLRISCR